MDINKERKLFQDFLIENFDFEHHEQTYFDEKTQCYENDHGEDTEVVNMAWEVWQAAKAIPEGFVLVPKLSANYLFNKVPELGFKHQDEKDTVLYHLNYMASEFKESAKNFVALDYEKQKHFAQESQEQSHDQ